MLHTDKLLAIRQIKDQSVNYDRHPRSKSQAAKIHWLKAIFCQSLVLLALGILSCDSFKDDLIQPEKQIVFGQTAYFILPGSSLVVDLQSILKQAYTRAQVIISKNPSRGELSTQDDLTLRYKPGPLFWNGTDQFELTISDGEGVKRKETVTVSLQPNTDGFPCGLYAVQDKVRAVADSSVAVNFLANDRHCGISNSNLYATIHKNAQFGEVKIMNDSLLVYTPGSAYNGHDEVVYKLTTSSGEVFSYGLITITDQWLVDFMSVPPTAPTKVFFVSEKIGFLSGYGIHRTTDGGMHWERISPSTTSEESVYYTDLFFLDANNGFASYSRCPEGGWGECFAGVAKTTDSGRTWKDIFSRSYFNVGSVFFTSPSRGFVGLIDSRFPAWILQTEDGGKNWKNAYNGVNDQIDNWNYLEDIQFVSATTGYALQRSKILKTTDGGESWELFPTDQHITTFASIPGDILCALTGADNPEELRPSSILRSQDGKTWTHAADLSSIHRVIGFSPSGFLGFTLGADNQDYSSELQKLLISKSLDQGVTWATEELYETVYGFPTSIAVPSSKVAYFLCYDKLIKYYRP